MSNAIEQVAGLLRACGPQRFVAALSTIYPDSDKAHMEIGARFGCAWEDIGRPVFKLDHSLAAMLSVTRAPPLDYTQLPMPLIVVDVPFEYAPIYEDIKQNCKIAFGYLPAPPNHDPATDGDVYIVGIFCNEYVGRWIAHTGGTINTEDSIVSRDNPEQTRAIKHAIRVAINTICYVNTYRERVETSRPRKDGTRSNTQLVRAPRDVIVDREFRLRAAQLVRSDSFAGARRALAHVVRGHWRNQPVGEGRKERKLTWIRPHRRGDESLGRVVQRIERLRAP